MFKKRFLNSNRKNIVAFSSLVIASALFLLSIDSFNLSFHKKVSINLHTMSSRRYQTSGASTNTVHNNKSWDGQAKDYLCQLFSRFTQDPSSGVSPHLNEDPQQVLRLHTNDPFLNRYKRNRFRDNFKNVANTFLLEQQQSGRRRKTIGK